MLTQPLFIIQLGRLSVRHSNYICQALSSNYTLTFAAFTCSCFNWDIICNFKGHKEAYHPNITGNIRIYFGY